MKGKPIHNSEAKDPTMYLANDRLSASRKWPKPKEASSPQVAENDKKGKLV
jgi:hypothetical protein